MRVQSRLRDPTGGAANSSPATATASLQLATSMSTGAGGESSCSEAGPGTGAAGAANGAEVVAATVQTVDANASASADQGSGKTKRTRTRCMSTPQWSEVEEMQLLELRKELGDRSWAGIAEGLGTGRTASGIEQHWYAGAALCVWRRYTHVRLCPLTHP